MKSNGKEETRGTEISVDCGKNEERMKNHGVHRPTARAGKVSRCVFFSLRVRVKPVCFCFFSESARENLLVADTSIDRDVLHTTTAVGSPSFQIRFCYISWWFLSSADDSRISDLFPFRKERPIFSTCTKQAPCFSIPYV